ncbi:MAG: hypothetical protein GYA21_03085 [Myxococcales bacterium]|nr:hypothetical protein [Myxococcales bacterium]
MRAAASVAMMSLVSLSLFVLVLPQCGEDSSESAKPWEIPDRGGRPLEETDPLPEIDEDDIEVEIVCGQFALPKYPWLDGRTYLIGEPGKEYAIRIINRSKAAVRAVVWVDGVNPSTLKFEDESSGWLIGEGKHAAIEGFWLSDNVLGTFVFTSPEDSLAAHEGLPRERVGEIRVAAYPGWIGMLHQHRNLAALGVGADKSQEPSGELGTGIGRRIVLSRGGSRLSSGVTFERAEDRAPVVKALYYDTPQSLCRRGVWRFCR